MFSFPLSGIYPSECIDKKMSDEDTKIAARRPQRSERLDYKALSDGRSSMVEKTEGKCAIGGVGCDRDVPVSVGPEVETSADVNAKVSAVDEILRMRREFEAIENEEEELNKHREAAELRRKLEAKRVAVQDLRGVGTDPEFRRAAREGIGAYNALRPKVRLSATTYPNSLGEGEQGHHTPQTPQGPLES